MSIWALQTLRSVSSLLQKYQDGRVIPPNVVDSSLLSLELVYREYLAKRSLSNLDDSEEEASRYIVEAVKILTELQDQAQTGLSNIPPLILSGRPGRPQFDVSEEQLTYLIENNFTAPQMAKLVGVSLRTIERRMSAYGLSIRGRYSDVTDAELEQVMSEIKSVHPQCGNIQMKGHLLSRGLRVQQRRIRETLRAVDPEGSIMRRLVTINRRKYSVPAPRWLWHIDGNHKLIRYV